MGRGWEQNGCVGCDCALSGERSDWRTMRAGGFCLEEFVGDGLEELELVFVDSVVVDFFLGGLEMVLCGCLLTRGFVGIFSIVGFVCSGEGFGTAGDFSGAGGV